MLYRAHEEPAAHESIEGIEHFDKVIDVDKSPSYVVHVLRLPEARAHLEGDATGSSNSMRNISQGTLRATPIPLPRTMSSSNFPRICLKLKMH